MTIDEADGTTQSRRLRSVESPVGRDVGSRTEGLADYGAASSPLKVVKPHTKVTYFSLQGFLQLKHGGPSVPAG